MGKGRGEDEQRNEWRKGNQSERWGRKGGGKGMAGGKPARLERPAAPELEGCGSGAEAPGSRIAALGLD